jgi:glutamate carboxypeptidase
LRASVASTSSIRRCALRATVQFVAPYTVGIDGLGAQGHGAHTDDEDLDIASIERGAVRAALLVYRLTQSASQ